MKSQMQSLLTQVQALQLANTPNHGNNYGRSRDCGRGRGAARGRRRGWPSAPLTPKYCWNHRNCAHFSKKCTYPADRHKKDASFAHMIGSSTNRCYNITKRKAGAVDLRHKNSKILSLNKPTVAHTNVIPKALPNTTATSHYLNTDDLPHCYYITRTTSGPTVQGDNGNTIKNSYWATLKFSNKIYSKAQSSHVFKDIATGSLISMGQLYDDDCIAIFTKFDVISLKHN